MTVGPIPSGMGRYIAQADLEAAYGASNIAEWADANNDQAADAIAARVEEAILDAEALVHDRLRGGAYTIPLQADDGDLRTIKQVCRSLAAFDLYKRRGLNNTADTTKLTADHDHAHKTLDSIQAGQMRLGLVRNSRTVQAPVVVTPMRAARAAARTGNLEGAPMLGLSGPFAVPHTSGGT